MRLIMFLLAAITTLSLLFKWRYKLLDTILGIRALKKVFVVITMNIPLLRKRLLPTVFNHF